MFSMRVSSAAVAACSEMTPASTLFSILVSTFRMAVDDCARCRLQLRIARQMENLDCSARLICGVVMYELLGRFRTFRSDADESCYLVMNRFSRPSFVLAKLGTN